MIVTDAEPEVISVEEGLADSMELADAKELAVMVVETLAEPEKVSVVEGLAVSRELEVAVMETRAEPDTD